MTMFWMMSEIKYIQEIFSRETKIEYYEMLIFTEMSSYYIILVSHKYFNI